MADNSIPKILKVASGSMTTRNGKPTTMPEEDVTAPEIPVESVDQSPMPWLKASTVKPHLKAGPQDYLNRPSTIADIEKLYNAAGPSFSPLQNKVLPEQLEPINPEGRLGVATLGAAEKDEHGGMHAKADIPTDSMAIIHSHTHAVDDRPSDDDYKTATRVGKPNFVVSGSEIYVAEPGGSTKHPLKVADIRPEKGGHLKINWAKDNPVITDKTPVYDRGGDVNVNDGRHQVAILEHGERVLTPEEANMYREEHGLPKIKLYDDGGDVKVADSEGKEGQALAEKSRIIDEYKTSQSPVLIKQPESKYTPSAHDLVNRNRKYGDRPGEKRINVDEYLKPLGSTSTPVYDNGGDVETIPSASTEDEIKPRTVLIAPPELTPERGTPEERAAVAKDKQDAMGQGTNGIVKLGLAKIHENHLEPTTSDSTESQVEPRTVGLPKIALPQEQHQDVAGGALIPGAPSSYDKSTQRDFASMKYKAQLADYDKQIRAALDEATPEGQEKADRLSLAKEELVHRTPWGSEANHPGILGKIGHVAEHIAARLPVSSEIMAQIPGTEAFRNAQHNSTIGRIQTETPLATARSAQDNRESASPSWKEVTGGAVDPRHPELGPQQAFYNEKNPSQITFSGPVPPKGSGDKAETREQHLNRYAELKNLQEAGPLSTADQKEFNTLRTELTVPPTVIAEHNKAIDNSLRKAGVPQEQWADYHVQPGATSEEDKEATAQARAFAGETYQQGSEGRTIDKEDRAQQRKDQATTVYAEDANGQLIKTTKFDAEKRGLSYEEMKPGDINKDRQALRMLSDVQINTSRYTKAASKYDAAKLTDAQREVDRDNISKMLNSAGLYTLEASISQGGHITVPMITAVGESLSRKARSDEYKKLSPEAKDLFDGYIRTMAAVPAYQKSLTGIGRSNKEMLDLELANIANPTMDPKDILRKQSQFQENIDQAAAGFPNNLPGVKHPSETRRETEKPSGSGESLSVEAPNGTVYNFKTKAEADAFRKKAGL